MKAVKITELDTVKDFPVGYIIKSNSLDEMVGCCPKAFINFFGLLGLIDPELNSNFLFWLKAELQEDEETLITPVEGIKNFIKNPIFNNLECGGGLIYDLASTDLIYYLSSGWVMFSTLLLQGTEKPSHCEVYYFNNGRLFCNGVEISLKTFVQKAYCHPQNRYIFGRKK